MRGPKQKTFRSWGEYGYFPQRHIKPSELSNLTRGWLTIHHPLLGFDRYRTLYVNYCHATVWGPSVATCASLSIPQHCCLCTILCICSRATSTSTLKSWRQQNLPALTPCSSEYNYAGSRGQISRMKDRRLLLTGHCDRGYHRRGCAVSLTTHYTVNPGWAMLSFKIMLWPRQK